MAVEHLCSSAAVMNKLGACLLKQWIHDNKICLILFSHGFQRFTKICMCKNFPLYSMFRTCTSCLPYCEPWRMKDYYWLLQQKFSLNIHVDRAWRKKLSLKVLKQLWYAGPFWRSGTDMRGCPSPPINTNTLPEPGKTPHNTYMEQDWLLLVRVAEWYCALTICPARGYVFSFPNGKQHSTQTVIRSLPQYTGCNFHASFAIKLGEGKLCTP